MFIAVRYVGKASAEKVHTVAAPKLVKGLNTPTAYGQTDSDSG